MELDELKASWNAFDKRLAESDIVNLRMVKEMIAQKTRRAFDRIYGLNVYYFVVSLLILGLVFPYVYMNTPISTTSFVIVETILDDSNSQYSHGGLLYCGTGLQHTGQLRAWHKSNVGYRPHLAHLCPGLCDSPMAAPAPCHTDAGDRARPGGTSRV